MWDWDIIGYLHYKPKSYYELAAVAWVSQISVLLGTAKRTPSLPLTRERSLNFPLTLNLSQALC